MEDFRYAIQIAEDSLPSVQGREADQEEGGESLAELQLKEKDSDIIRTFQKEKVPAQGFRAFRKRREATDLRHLMGQIADMSHLKRRPIHNRNLMD